MPANKDLQLYGHLPVPICICEGCRLVLGNVCKKECVGEGTGMYFGEMGLLNLYM